MSDMQRLHEALGHLRAAQALLRRPLCQRTAERQLDDFDDDVTFAIAKVSGALRVLQGSDTEAAA